MKLEIAILNNLKGSVVFMWKVHVMKYPIRAFTRHSLDFVNRNQISVYPESSTATKVS